MNGLGFRHVTDDSPFDLRYLFHVLTTRGLNQLRNQNTQPLITGTLVKGEILPFPPSDVQGLIVSYLDHKTSLMTCPLECSQS
jgi:hypothetical protein